MKIVCLYNELRNYSGSFYRKKCEFIIDSIKKNPKMYPN